MAWKGVWKGATGVKSTPCQRKTDGGFEKLWNRKRITKNTYAGCGLETK
jgi:hypothetical protein